MPRYRSMECPHCGMLSGEVGKVYYTLQRLSSNNRVTISGIDLAMQAQVKSGSIYMHLQRLKNRKFLTWKTGTGGNFSTYYLKGATKGRASGPPGSIINLTIKQILGRGR